MVACRGGFRRLEAQEEEETEKSEIYWSAGVKIAYVRARARRLAGETHLSPFPWRLNTCDNTRQRRSTSLPDLSARTRDSYDRIDVACHADRAIVSLSSAGTLTMERSLRIEWFKVFEFFLKNALDSIFQWDKFVSTLLKILPYII